jgi:hypothetical protein
MQYWNNLPKISATLVALFLTSLVFAQENSPYSRYGIGNLKTHENVANRGMGGVSIADDNPTIANPTNPATYASLRLTSYQVGMEGSRLGIKNANLTNQTGYAGINYVTIGFAASKKLGFSFGLLPASRVRYNMERTDTLSYSQATSSYSGGGGLQNVYVGGAYKHDIYSIGLNLGYTFGNYVNGTEVVFTDSLRIIPNNYNTRTSANGLFYQIGGLINKDISKDYQLKVGLSYTGAQTLSSKKDEIWDYVASDTIYYNDKKSSGKIKIPSKFAIGGIFSHGDHWQIGLDINASNWEKYRSYGESDSLGQAYLIRIGGAYTPDANAVVDYWKKMTFRMGFYTGQDILRFQNESLKKSAMTLGIGYPIRRTNLSIGQINASLELGRRGVAENGLVRESFTRFSVGLTFNDKWFIKRRYD